MSIPVALFVFNRPRHAREVLEALARCELAEQVRLHVFSDGPRAGYEEDLANVCAVRDVVSSVSWCEHLEIKAYRTNRGLARNIVGGITEVLARETRVVVLEDDIVVAPGFLRYMRDALDIYEAEPRVMHVSGFMFPVQKRLPETFFYNANSCWGWGTWRRAWCHYHDDAAWLLKTLQERFGSALDSFNKGQNNAFMEQLIDNVEGRLQTWAVKWHASIYLRQGLCLHPRRSLIQNIGFDGTGTHSGLASDNFRALSKDSIRVKPIPLVESADAIVAVAAFHRRLIRKRDRPTVRMLLGRVRRWLKSSFYQNVP